jgi:hypothetical protein
MVVQVSAVIAPAGQDASHAPQSIQSSAAILNGAPDVIAPWGHSPIQLPQLSHLSVILNAM